VKYRAFGNTGVHVSELSLGTWQVGGKWGAAFDVKNAERVLRRAMEGGVNFIDTADVYSDGESEKAVGKFVRECGQPMFVATKCGRRLSPHVADAYTPKALREFVESSLGRLGLERIDLIQLHCPPTAVYYRPEIFGTFERLREEGKIAHLGVSVEKVEEALKAIEFDNVRSVQIIYNLFRLRPRERFFEQAARRHVAVIVRVPLASGLLTGHYRPNTTFEPGDHRHFNRDGAAFDKGETFSGVPYDVGLAAVERLKGIFPNIPLHLAALRFVLDTPGVTTVIPGASNPQQMDDNLRAVDLPSLTPDQLQQVSEVYGELIRQHVHALW
jgi:aryl-alcohol dehydrogenase-like predicted oxidoreductase